MYLKKIELLGFKTFAHKTELEFTSGITCIVGPNGSGKSNIADAIRWVLGEQSMKSLRGSKLEEVIFAGTKDVKPLSLAQVSLTLENEDRKLPIDLSQVCVERKTFRSGESEYSINKSLCRLKDIHELFMGTGLGKNTYSLVNQGQVDLVLSSKPEERRLLLEEAAGISRLKQRKKEALKKLEIMRENLLRLGDIIREVNNQLMPLKNQAEKAEKYKEIQDKLKSLEINLLANQLKAKKEELEQIKEKENLIKEKFQKSEEKIKEIEKNRETKRNNLKNSEERKLQYFEKQKIISQNLEETKTKIAVINERIESIKEKIQTLDTQLIDLNSNFEKMNEEIKNIDTQFLEIKNFIKIKEEDIINYNAQINSIVETKKSKTLLVNNKKEELIEEERKIARLHNEIFLIEKDIRDREKLEEKIEEKINGLKQKEEKVNSEIISLEEEIAKINVEIEELKGKIEKKHEEKEEKEDELRKIIEERNALKEELSIKVSLKNWKEQKYAGVKKILESGIPGVLGTVENLIKIPSELEEVMEIILGEHLKSIVCENEDVAKKCILYLKEKKAGRVNFLPINIDKEIKDFPNIPGVKGRASDLVNFPSNIKGVVNYLLGNVLIVENEDAFEKIAEEKISFRIVDLSGNLREPEGIISGGIIDKKDIEEKIKEIEEKISQADARERETRDRLNNLKDKEKQNREHLSAKEQGVNNKIRDLEIFKIEKSKLQEEINIVNEEARTIREGKNKIIQNIKNLRMQEIALKEKINQISTDLQNLIIEGEAVEKENEKINLSITQIKIELASLNEKERVIKEKKDNLEKEKELLINKLENLKTEKEQLINRENELNYELENSFKLKENLEKESEDFQKNVKSLEEEYKTLEEEVFLLEKNIEEERKEWSILKEELHSEEIKRTQVEMENKEVISKLEENFKITPSQALEKLEEIEDKEKVLNQITKLKATLESLGPVNIMAIEEYNRQKERFAFLKEQEQDLKEGENSLRKVIRKIDTEVKEEFLKTFREVGENFSQIFQELFGGGEAKLILLEEDNLLETGIEIEVQLPGKRRQNLLLLSGGERSLVAIALLFSILKTKPSPFCILDEIDAALDEINVKKFTHLLKIFSQATQFIVITHNKQTMEIADVLHGITMEEEGISKLVSVKLVEKLI